jgi:hypothetical protein
VRIPPAVVSAAPLLLLGMAACRVHAPPHPPPELTTCDEIAHWVRENPEAQPETRPVVREPSQPWRRPVPRGTMVRFFVDETGQVEPGTITIFGLQDPAARRDIEWQVSTWTFVPARLRGCPVRAPFRVDF